MLKVEASKATLEKINPDVVIETHGTLFFFMILFSNLSKKTDERKAYNISKIEYFDTFLQELNNSGIEKNGSKKVDLVSGCVDNFEGRIGVNQGIFCGFF